MNSFVTNGGEKVETASAKTQQREKMVELAPQVAGASTSTVTTGKRPNRSTSSVKEEAGLLRPAKVPHLVRVDAKKDGSEDSVPSARDDDSVPANHRLEPRLTYSPSSGTTKEKVDVTVATPPPPAPARSWYEVALSEIDSMPSWRTLERMELALVGLVQRTRSRRASIYTAELRALRSTLPQGPEGESDEGTAATECSHCGARFYPDDEEKERDGSSSASWRQMNAPCAAGAICVPIVPPQSVEVAPNSCAPNACRRAEHAAASGAGLV
eukprot:CAMPEP_0113561032 /NCGR_PEP_ID=MMETSP0015_2-20120614/19760_1 /TAXON_ID=2838 /ORGANISM="Odontella" /LENGTH=269 /DNA_ID=CAMNT_0000462801 /DNA_START=126 /DNA_END=936 /DNA_ORIENTATION=+ /assembly_acc=CAM_ASM_000160